MRLPKSVLAMFAAWLLCLPAVGWAQVVFSYNSDVTSCEWLDTRYDEVLARNEEQLEWEVNPDVFQARLWTRFFFIITGDFVGDGSELLPEAPSLGGRVEISGSIVDIAKAARRKNCYTLYERYAQHVKDGTVARLRPTPARSVLSPPPR